MVAARNIHDEQSYLTYWTPVAGYEYSAEELCAMEHSFVDMMSDWCERADEKSEDEDEDILYASDSDIINSNSDLDDLTLDKKESAHFITIISSISSSSSSSPSSSPSQLKHVSSMSGEREARLMHTLEIMTEGLKASARRWDPLHEHCSWFAEVDHSTSHAELKYNVCEDEKHLILNRVSSDECREAQLLEAASWRLKESAYKTCPVYARTLWCSRTTML